MTLSEAQRAAARRIGQDVCVVAGPGSGKTRVLVERFRWLVAEQGISPGRVLAITFTEKAATEIKQRLMGAFAGHAEACREIERAYVSTVHGFCARLLRENPIAAGLDPEFSVMDEAQSGAELEEAAHQALDQLFQERPAELRALLEALSVSTWGGGRAPDLAGSLMGIYEARRIAGVHGSGSAPQQAGGNRMLARAVEEIRAMIAASPARMTPAQSGNVRCLREWLERASPLTRIPVSVTHFRVLKDLPRKMPRLAAFEGLKKIRDEGIPAIEALLIGEYYSSFYDLLFEAVSRIDRIYRERKDETGALDFSDLEERAIELLRRNPTVRAVVAQGFDHILMDELQDTNPLQWTLLGLIRSPNRFFAVGDINQSIYGFRHAAPEVFLEYRSRIEAGGNQVEELYENHRSREDILSAAGWILDGAGGIEPRRLVAARRFREKSEPAVEVIVGAGQSREEASEIEAQRIAERIRELVGVLAIEDKGEQRATRWKDVAVLVRSVNALPPIERAFRRWAIPYLTAGGRNFFEAREVRDLVYLLRAIVNTNDEIALAGVLRSPVAGVSDETLLRLRREGSLASGLARLRRIDSSQFDRDDLERLQHFRDRLRRMRAESDDVSPDRLLVRAIDDCGYLEGLDPRACANVDKLLSLVRDWYERQPRPAARLLEDLDWLRSSQSEPDAPPDDSSDVVRVMTIHQAKGLQFPIVFLAALQRGTDRSSPPICLAPQGALGARWRNPASGDGVPDAVHAACSRFREEKEKAEEDRLFYVAMTRAEEHLVLSFAKTRHPGDWSRKVTAALKLDLETIDNQLVLHRPSSAPFSVRLLRADAAPAAVPPPAPAAASGQEGNFLVVPRPLVTDQHDSTVAVTSILTFDSCPQRYYLGPYLGWRREPRPAFSGGEEPVLEPDAAGFGLAVHGVLAGGPADDVKPEALEMASRFHSSDLGRRAARASRVEREFDFVMALDDVVLRGQMDLWFEEGGELVLVDYKTDNVQPGAVQERAQSYALQLRLYALALERYAGKLPDRAFLYFLRPDVAIPVQLDAPRMTAAQSVVRALRQAQSSLEFELREGDQCFRCPFHRGLCRSRWGNTSRL